MQRILLLEDEAELRTLLQHILLSAEYEVDVADTVKGAGELLEQHRYDLILADARLEDGTGMSVAQQAQKRGARALIITGYAFELPKDELRGFEFLLKPVRPNELLEAVERVLHSAQL